MSPNLRAIEPHQPGACVMYVPAGETIHVGADIQINIGRSVEGRVALSISAPRQLDIDRASRLAALERA
jgi:sRNA-binding carbon storage regulator CsrA